MRKTIYGAKLRLDFAAFLLSASCADLAFAFLLRPLSEIELAWPAGARVPRRPHRATSLRHKAGVTIRIFLMGERAKSTVP
jgi:hypothetical protein